jgi:hypothetical protein
MSTTMMVVTIIVDPAGEVRLAKELVIMRKTIFAFLGFTLSGAAHSPHAECIVADPSPTPLNVRTAPYGRIVGSLDNGQVVSILDSSIDKQGQPWVYVADDAGSPLGWVNRE